MTSRRSPDSERQLAKLRKINQVLMDRVERSMDFQGNAFSLFQTAIVLEGRIRERTLALEGALRDLESANRALSLAREDEAQAKSLLSEAIETISEGFVLCDADDRLVLVNSKYRAMWPAAFGAIEPGMTFAEVLRRAVLGGHIVDAQADPDGWIARRLASHRQPGEPFVVQFADGTWMQVSERRTRDGGVVGLYTDITEIKASERRRRERELAEKSVLLQATLDNLSQGVSVFDRALRLVAWNQRFADLLGVAPERLAAGSPLAGFLDLPAMRLQFAPDGDGRARASQGGAALIAEHEGADGRVLEVRRNRMPDGGFVSTYTDITDRKRSEEALRDSERRIRLITDAMPALIAYVDAQGTYRFTNKAYENWFGRPRSQIDGRPMREVLGADLYDKRAEFVEVALAGQECSFEMTLPVGDGAGRVQYALATYVPHWGEGGGEGGGGEGSVQGFFALIQDITERRLAAEALREAKESLERRVEERTAELRQANADLSAAKQEAEQANLSKTRFLAAASHDLLQPLAAARVYAAALAERRLAPRNKAVAGSLLAALDSVDELLTALLDISKLDAGVQPVEPRAFRMDDLFASLVEEYRVLARAKGLDLRLRPCGAAVRTDPRLLGRILRNFISNAVRYTDRGRVLVACRRRGAVLLVGVWDTGCGIPADKTEEIFEEFRRLNRPPARPGQGTGQGGTGRGAERGIGLGLAIVKRIARTLDLPLVVRSVEGRGSLFGVEVPLLSGPLPAAAMPERPPAPVPAHTLGGARVLMIDNEPDILDGMAALLEGWGCRTVGVASAAEALAYLGDGAESPGLIIADYHLDDGLFGLDAIAAVQAALPGGPVPAVVVTADHAPGLVQAVRAAGYHLLNKPVQPGRLRSLMAHLLSGG